MKALQGQVASLASKAPSQGGAGGIGYAEFIQGLQTELSQVAQFAQKQSGPTAYVVSDFTLSLKALKGVDSSGKPVLSFPSASDVDPGLLSTINIHLSPVPVFSPQSPAPPRAAPPSPTHAAPKPPNPPPASATALRTQPPAAGAGSSASGPAQKRKRPGR